ncbi:hypothetical protein QQF64_031307 [Cirrhinus molitorella]|uniref:Uncharacterized protein n=1 Tax=Cirrhinus molitorella TaxID=172907 RepID=A0ABR3MWK1_9TELE
MAEAYRIAEEHSRQSSARGKEQYDRKARAVIMKPGDRVLVQNLAGQGSPGKLRSYWEKTIYVVKEQVSDNPVYVVCPENGGHCAVGCLKRDMVLGNDPRPLMGGEQWLNSLSPKSVRKYLVSQTEGAAPQERKENSRADKLWHPSVDISHLEEEQQKIVREMLYEESNAFTQGDDDTGCIPSLQMSISLKDNIPILRAYASTPKPLYKEVKEYIQDLLA